MHMVKKFKLQSGQSSVFNMRTYCLTVENTYLTTSVITTFRVPRWKMGEAVHF